MSRFFIEVAYDGLKYSGFQKQANAVTIQSEVEKCLFVYYRRPFDLTGASRTDAGVHAHQNYFHFDDDIYKENSKDLIHLNKILPLDIVVKKIILVPDDLHCRFDAVTRSYEYMITREKNPFLIHRAFYFSYSLDLQKLKEASRILLVHTNFQAFSKKNSQVHTFNCLLKTAEWELSNNVLVFNITGNRFLRGMVRGIVGTMLNVGKGKISPPAFGNILEEKDSSKANFAVPPHGLYLKEITYGNKL